MSQAPWCVYLARCGDGTLYCGVTNDVLARAQAHDEGRGARFTRGRAPVVPVFVVEVDGRSAALSLEAAVKRLGTTTKRALAAFHEGASWHEPTLPPIGGDGLAIRPARTKTRAAPRSLRRTR